MPDVPQRSDDILRAARDRAGVVACQMSALAADLDKPRPAVLGDADRRAGVEALAAAAAALRALGAVIDAGGSRDVAGA